MTNTHTGTFIDGVFSGKGRFTRADGSETYDGTFKAGQRNGHGVAIINVRLFYKHVVYPVYIHSYCSALISMKVCG